MANTIMFLNLPVLDIPNLNGFSHKWDSDSPFNNISGYFYPKQASEYFLRFPYDSKIDYPYVGGTICIFDYVNGSLNSVSSKVNAYIKKQLYLVICERYSSVERETFASATVSSSCWITITKKDGTTISAWKVPTTSKYYKDVLRLRFSGYAMGYKFVRKSESVSGTTHYVYTSYGSVDYSYNPANSVTYKESTLSSSTLVCFRPIVITAFADSDYADYDIPAIDFPGGSFDDVPPYYDIETPLSQKPLSSAEYDYLTKILDSLKNWDTSLNRFPPTVSDVQELIDYYNSIGKNEEADYLSNIQSLVGLLDNSGCFIDENAKQDFLYKLNNGIEDIYLPESYLLNSGIDVSELEKFKPTFFGQFMDSVYSNGLVDSNNKTILPILGAVIGAGVGIVTAPYITGSLAVSAVLHASALGLTVLFKDELGKLFSDVSKVSSDSKYSVTLVGSDTQNVPAGFNDLKNIYSPPSGGLSSYVPPSGSVLESLQQNGYFDKVPVVKPPLINPDSNSVLSNSAVQDYIDEVQNNLQIQVNKPILPGQTVVYPDSKPSNLPTNKPGTSTSIPVPNPSVNLPNGGGTQTNTQNKPLNPGTGVPEGDSGLLQQILNKVNEIGGEMGKVASAIEKQTEQQKQDSLLEREVNMKLSTDLKVFVDSYTDPVNVERRKKELSVISFEEEAMLMTSSDGLNYAQREISKFNDIHSTAPRSTYTDSVGNTITIPEGSIHADYVTGKYYKQVEEGISVASSNVATIETGQGYLEEHEEKQRQFSDSDFFKIQAFGVDFEETGISLDDDEKESLSAIKSFFNKFKFKYVPKQ